MGKITIKLNGQPYSTDYNASVLDIINQLKLTPKTIIAELNNEIIHKSNYTNTYCASNDSLELIQYLGGGNFIPNLNT